MTPNANKPATRLICPLTAGSAQQMRADMAAAVALGADTVECRLDYLSSPPGEAEMALLLENPPADVIVTCRPPRQGGRWQGDEDQRLALLRAAARFRPAFIDVEDDVSPSAWPGAPIILSHHDFARTPADLDEIASRLEHSEASVNKIAFAAGTPVDALRALDVVRQCQKPTLALAMGEAGLLSRVLAPVVGAFGTFAALERGRESAPGQPTLEEMANLYRWRSINARTMICGVVGSPVGHSMSPAIHNAAFAAAGVDGVYLSVLVDGGAAGLDSLLDELVKRRRWLNWRGFSVILPLKEAAFARLGGDDELTRRIGAVNTITIDSQHRLHGANTDYAAAVGSLCAALGIAHEQLAGRAVAVLGAGGVARAVVAAMTHHRADVTIYNRTVGRGAALAAEFGAKAEALSVAERISAEVIINCTSIGMHPNVDESPLESIPAATRVVFDTIYNPIHTRLIQLATAAGCRTVTGDDMFVRQAFAQFELWTGKPAPVEVMRGVVLARLGATEHE